MTSKTHRSRDARATGYKKPKPSHKKVNDVLSIEFKRVTLPSIWEDALPLFSKSVLGDPKHGVLLLNSFSVKGVAEGWLAVARFYSPSEGLSLVCFGGGVSAIAAIIACHEALARGDLRLDKFAQNR